MLAPDDATGSMEWMSQGACQREDPELFFPLVSEGPALEQINAAKRICYRCTVRTACLAFGLTTQEGIWGGATPGERRAIRKHPARAAAHPYWLASPADSRSRASGSPDSEFCPRRLPQAGQRSFPATWVPAPPG